MANQKLDERLNQIQHIAEQQDVAHQQSRRLLWQSLAESYVWWKEASWDNTYLEKVYADNGVSVRGQKANQITKADFLKLVKLIYIKQAKSSKNAQLISNWAAALYACYHRFANDDGWLRVADKNQKQAVSEIINFVRDSNGITALANKFRNDGEDEGFEVAAPSSPKSSKARNNTQTPTEERRADNKKALLNLKKTHLPNVRGDLLTADLSVAADNDNLAVILVKKNGEKLEVLGSTTDETAVNATLTEVGLAYTGDVAPSLRLLCEALAIHAPPKQLKNTKGRFYPKYIAKMEGADGNTVEIKDTCYPRLLILKDGTMLISKRHQNASLTSVINPKTALSKGSELFLRGNDRDFLEQELINNGFLPLYTAQQSAKLVKAEDGFRASKVLTLKHNNSKYERPLYFYDTTWLDVGGEPQMATPQAMPVIPSKYKFNFKLVADSELLKSFSKKFEEWATKKNNVYWKSSDICIDFEVRDNDIRIHEWWENGGYVRMEKLAFSRRARLTKSALTKSKGGIKGIRISPLDIAQLSLVLPKLQLKNNRVTIEGSADLLKFSYETELASYEVFIPSVNEWGKANEGCFREYQFVNLN